MHSFSGVHEYRQIGSDEYHREVSYCNRHDIGCTAEVTMDIQHSYVKDLDTFDLNGTLMCDKCYLFLTRNLLKLGDINRYDELYGDGDYGACVIYPEFDSDVESISVEFRRSDDTLISSGTSSTSGS